MTTADRWRRHVRRLPWPADTEAAFAALFGAGGPSAPAGDVFWLDSSRPGDGTARYSYLGAGVPGRAVTSDDGPVLDRLARRLREVEVVGAPSPVPFGGGFVGYLGHEARHECGHPVRHRAPTPDAVWARVDRLVAVDHREAATHLVALVPDGDPPPTGWFDTTAATLASLRPLPGPPPASPVGADQVAAVLAVDRERYLADVRRCLVHLREGDSYEICLTTQAAVPVVEEGLTVHRRLRRANPAPYGAYVRLGGVEIACASPERFLHVTADGVVETRPIKGTAPRGASRSEDDALAAALAADTKTRAENLMVVDLLRNDLHRVCEPGSVAVPRLMAVERHATVHQLVTTVSGRLRAGLGAVDALRACFPGGSMTGAPKHRTLEILDRIEGRTRGVYSGALGWLGLDGAADLAIVIRTAVGHRGTWRVGAGGGIVLDSDPAAEYEEMLLKAAVPLQALLASQTAPGPAPRRGRPVRAAP
ncbi:MAG: anthranilate synthase component I family protein [Kineosporiaceae bacterium]